jgi:hypothetical protein
MGVGVEEKIGPGRYVEHGDHRDLTGGCLGNGGAAHEMPGSDGGGIRPTVEEEEAENFFHARNKEGNWAAGPQRGYAGGGGPGEYGGWVCERRVKKVRCFWQKRSSNFDFLVLQNPSTLSTYKNI